MKALHFSSCFLSMDFSVLFYSLLKSHSCHILQTQWKEWGRSKITKQKKKKRQIKLKRIPFHFPSREIKDRNMISFRELFFFFFIFFSLFDRTHRHKTYVGCGDSWKDVAVVVTFRLVGLSCLICENEIFYTALQRGSSPKRKDRKRWIAGKWNLTSAFVSGGNYGFFTSSRGGVVNLRELRGWWW